MSSDLPHSEFRDPRSQVLHPLQIAAWKRMSPGEKYDLFLALMRTVRDLKRIGIRAVHRDWTEEQVEQETARIFLRART